jgi:hypothetical protein
VATLPKDPRGRPARELAGYQVAVTGDDGVVQPPTTSQSTSVLIPFYAGAFGETVTVEAWPSAGTELDTGMRAWFNFTGLQWVRVQARIEDTDAPAGAKCRVDFTTDGATWTALDGASGPEMAVDAAGDIKGDEVQLAAAAQADVLLRLVAIGGTD